MPDFEVSFVRKSVGARRFWFFEENEVCGRAIVGADDPELRFNRGQRGSPDQSVRRVELRGGAAIDYRQTQVTAIDRVVEIEAHWAGSENLIASADDGDRGV